MEEQGKKKAWDSENRDMLDITRIILEEVVDIMTMFPGINETYFFEYIAALQFCMLEVSRRLHLSEYGALEFFTESEFFRGPLLINFDINDIRFFEDKMMDLKFCMKEFNDYFEEVRLRLKKNMIESGCGEDEAEESLRLIESFYYYDRKFAGGRSIIDKKTPKLSPEEFAEVGKHGIFRNKPFYDAKGNLASLIEARGFQALGDRLYVAMVHEYGVVNTNNRTIKFIFDNYGRYTKRYQLYLGAEQLYKEALEAYNKSEEKDELTGKKLEKTKEYLDSVKNDWLFGYLYFRDMLRKVVVLDFKNWRFPRIYDSNYRGLKAETELGVSRFLSRLEKIPLFASTAADDSDYVIPFYKFEETYAAYKRALGGEDLYDRITKNVVKKKG